MYYYSKYNYNHNYNGDNYCYNFLNGNLIDLKKWTKKYQNVIINSIPIETWDKQYPELFEILKETGFVYNNEEVNELEIIKLRNRRDVFVNGNFRLTILPTLECNYRCWYCYESHPEGRITKEVMNSIYKLVKNKIKNKEISSLELDWFGGEPLLYFNDVIYPLSKKLLQLSKDNKIKFHNQITTNGYLLNESTINKLLEIKLNTFQITLDGGKKSHDKTKRHYNTNPTFETTIDNIINLCKSNTKSHVNLRLNYTKENILDTLEIIPLLPNNIRKMINVTFQEVWQEAIKNNEGIYDTVQDISYQFIKAGYLSNVVNFQIGTGFHCYADRWNQAVISVDGSVYKCTARDFVEKKNSDGYIDNSGEIIWNDKIYKRFSKATFENIICSGCEFLPLCLGPCSQKLVELINDNDIIKICNKESMKKSINCYIENTIRNLEHN